MEEIASNSFEKDFDLSTTEDEEEKDEEENNAKKKLLCLSLTFTEKHRKAAIAARSCLYRKKKDKEFKEDEKNNI